MDRFFSFLLRNKSVFSLKNRSRTGKTDDFSNPGTHTLLSEFDNRWVSHDFMSFSTAFQLYQERLEGDNGRLCAVEPHLRLNRFLSPRTELWTVRPAGQYLTHCATGAPKSR